MNIKIKTKKKMKKLRVKESVSGRRAQRGKLKPPDTKEAVVDPGFAEELERRKKTILALMNEKSYVPMKMKELAILLDIPKEKRRELKADRKSVV